MEGDHDEDRDSAQAFDIGPVGGGLAGGFHSTGRLDPSRIKKDLILADMLAAANRFHPYACLPKAHGISVVAALTIPGFIGRLVVFSYAPGFSAGARGYALARTMKPRLGAGSWPSALSIAIAAFNPEDDIDQLHKLPRTVVGSIVLPLVRRSFRQLVEPRFCRAWRRCSLLFSATDRVLYCPLMRELSSPLTGAAAGAGLMQAAAD